MEAPDATVDKYAHMNDRELWKRRHNEYVKHFEVEDGSIDMLGGQGGETGRQIGTT